MRVIADQIEDRDFEDSDARRGLQQSGCARLPAFGGPASLLPAHGGRSGPRGLDHLVAWRLSQTILQIL
jgi:hypothetical protein